MDLLPKVFRTEGNITDFDSAKIYESLLKETGLNEKDVARITELVVRRIINYGIKFLSGPHIREIVCSILSEQHFENERKIYTRIGMPLMDYEEILETNLNERVMNPEEIHHWAANKISEEYAHLRLLNSEESKAHLAGEIHIDGLNYFDSRPFNQIWDLRSILKIGIPFFNNIASFYKIKPASNLNEAVSHICKWAAMAQSEFYGLHSFDFLTIFLAPYIRDLSTDQIKRALRKLIYEINHLSVTIGRNIPPVSISLTPSIFEGFSKTPAITPNGKIMGTYEDYSEECLELFEALTNVNKEVNNSVESLKTPRFHILLDQFWFNEYSKTNKNKWDEIEKTSNTYFSNFCNKKYKDKILKQISTSQFFNTGVIQNICLNLPRYAYISKNEDKFSELIQEKMHLCSEIFSKKYKIIKRRLESKHLPLCSSTINGFSVFNLDNQKFTVSFVGLNEAVRFLTNNDLHESSDSFSYGVKIVKELRDVCSELSEKDKKPYFLSENTSNKGLNRFIQLDLRHFKEQIEELNLDMKNPTYSNSVHFRNDININLDKRIKEQGQFHQLIQMGAIEYISVQELQENNINLYDFIESICENSDLAQIKFIE